jgi:hypothetical protein
MSDDWVFEGRRDEVLEELRGIRRELREELRLLRRENKELRRIEHDVRPHLNLSKGQVNLMPKTIPVGGTANATLNLVGSDGNPFKIDATYIVAYAASVAGDVSLGTVNPDGSVVITGVNADPGDVIGCTVTPPSGSGSPVTLTPDTLTITQVTPPVTLASGSVVLS